MDTNLGRVKFSLMWREKRKRLGVFSFFFEEVRGNLSLEWSICPAHRKVHLAPSMQSLSCGALARSPVPYTYVQEGMGCPSLTGYPSGFVDGLRSSDWRDGINVYSEQCFSAVHLPCAAGVSSLLLVTATTKERIF